MNVTEQFEAVIPGMGRFHLRPLSIPGDTALIRHWLSQERAQYWGMGDMTEPELTAFYQGLSASGKGQGYLGFHEGAPAFLMETYDPTRDPVGDHYTARAGDRGMHILTAPPRQPVHGFGRAVFAFIMDFLFHGEHAERVVVEPDERNDAIHELNRFAGFCYDKKIALPDKTAALAFCSLEHFRASAAAELLARGAPAVSTLRQAPRLATAHLEEDAWRRVNRLQVRKSLSELAHEKLIEPRLLEPRDNLYQVNTDREGVVYRFRARRLALDHWLIDEPGLEKRVDDQSVPLDAQDLIIELRDTLSIDATMLPTYLEEISATLHGAVWKRRQSRPSRALVDASFQTLEAAMTEGHPCFIANNGRIGFDAGDYRAYAPEAGEPVRLVWVAAHRDHARFSCSDSLEYEGFMRDELGEEQWEYFRVLLREQNVDPADYLLIPVHPWQWFNKIAGTFAADIAGKKLICLGYGEHRYQAQQSIRTFFNLDAPEKHYVKTALSVLNMGFMRGLSPYYMDTTPAINDFIHGLTAQDPELSGNGFGILREVAGVGYRQRHFEASTDQYSPYRKMLSALWRESPLPRIGEDERLMTMAALLHKDADDKALVVELIRASGLDTVEWLRRYLRCYLRPLLHCFYQYELVFMPHGENLILVMRDHVPVRAIMKDIAEESAILDETVVLAGKVQRLAVKVPEELKVLSLFTDIFDCFFRFLSALLVEQAGLEEDAFWRQVAETIRDYQNDHPELEEKFRRYDLFAPGFQRSCLNRLQLKNNQQMVDLADPASALQFAGTLDNPVHPWAEENEGDTRRRTA